MGERDHCQVSSLRASVEAFYGALLAPGHEEITDATDLELRPGTARVSFTGLSFRSLTAGATTRICTLDLDTGVLQVRSAAAGNERLPRWSPDGTRLAYLADRGCEGTVDLHVARDGVPAVIMRVAGLIESILWSPTCRQIALVVAGTGANLAGCQGGFRAARTTASSDAAMDDGDTADASRHLWITDTESGRTERVSPEGLNVWEAAWLDSDSLVCVASASAGESSWYGARCVRLEASSGAVREIYSTRRQIGIPCCANGVIALIESTCSDRQILCGDLLLIDASGGCRRAEVGGVDVSCAVWRDPTTLVFAGLRGLETVIGELDLRTGQSRQLWASTTRTTAGWHPTIVAPARGGAVFISESYAIPPEIAWVGRGSYAVARSLATRAALAGDFSRATCEPFFWQAPDGLDLQGWLVKPSGSGPWPIVIDIHGGPVYAQRNRWQGRLRGTKVLADHGVATFFPNARGSSGRGQRFIELVLGDLAGADATDHLSAVDALIAAGIADPRRVGVSGTSYGAFMGAWLITQSDRFSAAALFSPISNWFSQRFTSHNAVFVRNFLEECVSPDGLHFRRSPVMYAARVTTPTLQLVGALDLNTPPTQALEFHRALLENGKESLLLTYPNAGHGLRGFPEVIDAAARSASWFMRHLRRHTPAEVLLSPASGEQM